MTHDFKEDYTTTMDNSAEGMATGFPFTSVIFPNSFNFGAANTTVSTNQKEENLTVAYYYQSSWYKPWVVTALILLMLLICVGNALVVAAYYQVRRLRTRNNMVLIQLPVTDLVAGLIIAFHIVTFSVFDTIKWLHLCILRYSLTICPGLASIFSLLMITVERYYAIVHPLKHRHRHTKRWSVIIGLVIWTPSLLVGFFLPFVWHKDWSYEHVKDCEMSLVLPEHYLGGVLSSIFVVVSFFIVYMYVKIETVRRQSNLRVRQKDITISKTVALILVCFFTCWTPVIAMMAVHSFSPRLQYTPTTISVRFFLMNLATLNSALNPIIYAIRLPEFRSAIREMVTGKKSKKIDKTISVISGSTNVSTSSRPSVTV